MWEKIVEIKDNQIPVGYLITYHESRGYDSPDRWIEVKRNGKLLKELGPREVEEAIRFSISDWNGACNNG
jgi:hypothetical protein